MNVENPYIIRCLYMRPDEEPRAEYLNNTESQMEDLLDGKIASVGVDEGICVFYNAYSELMHMPENRTIYGQTFYGPILLVAFNEFGDILNLNDEDFEYYGNMLKL